MVFKKPTVNKIKSDISNVSIYIRSTRKFGKSSLFRDSILEKYGNPENGLLIKCGYENGDKMLDELNSTQIESYQELEELVEWLVNEKGKEHDIRIVCFDTIDELVPMAEAQTIKMSRKINPDKPCKTINSAMGGYGEGRKYAANQVIKPLIGKLTKAGFGVWAIAHTRYKNIKDKGAIDDEGYMQLTSNLSNDYESAFADIFDIVLTGVIDRDGDITTKNVAGKSVKQKTVKEEVRKLYFRGTPTIDAGGRFQGHSDIPLYMVFEDGENNAATFIRLVEEGMEKSKVEYRNFGQPSKPTKKAEAKTPEPVVEDLDDEDEDLFEEEVVVSEPTKTYPDNLATIVKGLFKDCTNADVKAEAKAIIKGYGNLKQIDQGGLEELYDLLNG